ncbi:MAG: hypothetical protein R3C03_01725 [Pirellulaceae bacterium]
MLFTLLLDQNGELIGATPSCDTIAHRDSLWYGELDMPLSNASTTEFAIIEANGEFAELLSRSNYDIEARQQCNLRLQATWNNSNQTVRRAA